MCFTGWPFATEPASAAHATTDRDGVTRVVVLAKEAHAATANRTVHVTIELPCEAPRRTTGATLLRLAPKANGLHAVDGIAYAGQTLDGTPDGRVMGQRIPERINSTCQQGSETFAFELAPASAALLIVAA